MDATKGGALVLAGALAGTLWAACGGDGGGGDVGPTASSTSSAGTGGGGGTTTNTGTGGGLEFDAGKSDGTSGCNPQNFTLQQAPPAEVYLVIDRSGSMNDPGATPGLTRWQEMYAAVDLMLKQYENTIRFGLLMYPAGDECSTSGPQVAVDTNNWHSIMDQLTKAVPAGGTPTAAALNNASASLKALGSKESPKFIVLATDGGPNCNYFLTANPGCICSLGNEYCCTNYPQKCFFGHSCLDDEHTLQVIADLAVNQAIPTFVIGLAGTAAYEAVLTSMAEKGGKNQGPKGYYPANDQIELLKALQTIAVSVISCEIDLEEPPQNPEAVKVFMDGKEVPKDKGMQNGWWYTNEEHTKIELFGEACQTLQDGEKHTLTATFECQVR
ncbi:MAG: VWA domain-containing protein [Deltaproteobacteria bacterium]|nr:VWA domain-containing protein [Deltaproteobacteria bacterium]